MYSRIKDKFSSVHIKCNYIHEWTTTEARMGTRTTMTIKLNENMLFHFIWIDLTCKCACVCLYLFFLLHLLLLFIFSFIFALSQFALNFTLNGRILSFHAIKQFPIWIWIELNWEVVVFLVWGQLIIFTTQDKLCCHKIYLHINLSFEFRQQNGTLVYTNANLLT